MSTAPRPFLRYGLSLLCLGVLFSLSAVLTVSHLEEQDPFCAACHTAPEVEYVARAQAAFAGSEAQDLASAHYALAARPNSAARCIDCHRGNGGLRHRAQTLALGARDAVLFVSGQADATLEKGPASLAAPHLLNAACLQCHADLLQDTDFENHFHAELVETQSTVTCGSCHPAHLTVLGGSVAHYLDLAGRVYPACEQCHREVRGQEN